MEDARRLSWRRSTFCQADGCVEIANVGRSVLVRDSKLGDASPVLTFDEAEWRAFRSGVVSGEL